mgnify:CR=1 FL=1
MGGLVPMDRRPIEIVERKGLGHPDTICDSIGERIAVYLTKYYYENFGCPLHFNIDKCVLAGGRSQPRFGGGKVIEPILLHFVGRATLSVIDEKEESVPVGILVREAVIDWIRENFRYLDPVKHVSIMYTIRPGSVDLRSVYEQFKENYVPLANDTSMGVGFYPLSETERLCLEAERLLNSSNFKKKYPAVGEDVKVMCVRNRRNLKMTVGVAMVDREIRDADEYLSLKEEISRELYDRLLKDTDLNLDLRLNTADNPNKNIFYITVTGTSAESGDDGQIGRGNRWNGLITPLRYMSIEAHAGKNPVSHVGKIYQFAAQFASEKIYKETNVDEVYVLLVSTIGRPITEPQLAYIQYVNEGRNSDIENDMKQILNEVLEFLPKFWMEFMRGNISMV